MLIRSEDLMVRFQNGDHSAFDALVDQEAPHVRSYLFHFKKDSDEIDEVTQDVFLKVLTKKHRYNPAYPFKPWLFGIVVNTKNDWLRGKYRTTKNSRPLLEDEDYPVPPGTRPVESRIAVETAIQQLPEKLKEVLILQIEGFSTEEISRTLGVSPRTIEYKKQEAVEILRKRLASPAGPLRALIPNANIEKPKERG